MKKIAVNILIYTFISGLICFLIGMFAFQIPAVNANDVMAYRATNGLLWVLEILPSAVITGFIIGCSVYFGTLEIPHSRFSGMLISNFKPIIILCIAVTFCLSLSHDVLTPALNQKKKALEEKPVLISHYMTLAQQYQMKVLEKQEYAALAVYYSKKVIELDPSNEKAKELLKRAELAAAVKVTSQKDVKKVPSSNKNAAGPVTDQIDTVEIHKIKGSTTLELITESERLFKEEDYLGSHYYAQMAVKFAGENDVNLVKAKEYANRAWNIISEAQEEKLTEENMFFRTKIDGYKKLNAGDYLSAYYIFQTLANEKLAYERDPDVKRYLNLSREQLTDDYFFNDETTDKDAFESAENVYFSLRHNDGSYDIFYIKGITDINETGHFVRYLRGLCIFSFDSFGDFKQSMTVNYAKMLAVDVASLSSQKKLDSAIDDKWNTIPYVMLCSVDRNVKGNNLGPSYADKDGNPFEGPNQILLPMPYGDFDVLSQCSNGQHTMNFWTMSKMKIDASTYGFSKEIILQTVLTSVFYPFMIFIILLFCASIGWNYRLLTENLFKFVWIFVIPLFHFILYGVVGFFEFLLKLMNFIFIGIAGTSFALYLGIAFYTCWIIIMSFLFLSRKGD
ncbi:MAG: hypothetical protein KBT21_02770 [Treponema sp.]|nr:hypothetical protein [Candidatus Treponema merdequi]